MIFATSEAALPASSFILVAVCWKVWLAGRLDTLLATVRDFKNNKGETEGLDRA